MSNPVQPLIGTISGVSSVQDAIEHMRIDYAQTGAVKPSDLNLVLGDIRSSVVVSAINPDFGGVKLQKP